MHPPASFAADLDAVKGARGRPPGAEPAEFERVVVLGAGMMGAGIAYVCAQAGLEVVLKDVSPEAAERGKAYSERVLGRAVAKGRVTEADAAAVLARITPTDDPAAAADADLVVEAVFEDPVLKAQVFAEIEPHLAPDALLGSNTSTLPITGLATGVTRPQDFIGLHFFSPVDRMPLLEIIKGERTAEATLHRALDLAARIGKTPIVVNDSRGFFTSRVIGTFLNEALAMLGEGVPAADIEAASTAAGYPAPVLQLCDELNLTLMVKVRRETAAAAGDAWVPHPADAVMVAMLEQHGRAGRAAGGGFYEYDAGGRRTGLWPGLAAAFGGDRPIPEADVRERMLVAEVVGTIECLDEGVLESVADANVGAVLGIGFPAATGGPLAYVDNHPGGPAGFVARARELAERYAPRLAPPASVVALAEAGGRYTAADPSPATVS